MFLKLAEVLQLKYPSATPNVDYILQDDSDGKGPYIAQWNLNDLQPSMEELQAYWPEHNIDWKEPESELEQLKKQQADLTFSLMLAGVI